VGWNALVLPFQQLFRWLVLQSCLSSRGHSNVPNQDAVCAFKCQDLTHGGEKLKGPCGYMSTQCNDMVELVESSVKGQKPRVRCHLALSTSQSCKPRLKHRSAPSDPSPPSSAAPPTPYPLSSFSTTPASDLCSDSTRPSPYALLYSCLPCSFLLCVLRAHTV